MAAQEQPDSAWWTDWPSLFDAEMAAFAAQNATVRVMHQRHGLLIIQVDWPLGEGHVVLDIGYSPLHPFCRPMVSSSDMRVARHQHPFGGVLCLIVPSSGQWYAHQRVADFIAEQLPKIVKVNASRASGAWEEAAQLEEQAPDPLAAYYGQDAEVISAAYFASPTRAPLQSCGIAEFAINPRGAEGGTDYLEAVLRSAKPVTGKWLAQPFEPNWRGAWKGLEGRWVRLKRPLPQKAEDLLAAADAEIARQAVLNSSYRKLQRLGEADLSLTAILFEDEVAYGPEQMGDGWLFLVSRVMGKKKRHRSVSLIRGFGIADDLFSRVPVAAALRGKKVLLFGCGAVGSFVGMELARAGIGTLTILDHDIVEPGNSVRWPLGRQAWGVPKTAALRDFLILNYPSTQVDARCGRLGTATTVVSEELKESPLDQLKALIADADLVIDATASTECQAALADACRTLNKPLVIGYATEGVYGGIVVRLRPGAPGCWVCLNEHWHDKSIALPPANPAATVIPTGCNSPTFTGGSFDLQEVSMEVVRSAIGLLVPDAFDPGDWDWSALALKDQDGKRCLPSWTSGILEPHGKCTGSHPE